MSQKHWHSADEVLNIADLVDSKLSEILREVRKTVEPKVRPAATAVTEQAITESIQESQYYHFPDTTCTVCCLTLRNGYTVIGNSACINPEDFDLDLGRKYAYEDALRKVWDLLAFQLKGYIGF